MNKKTACTYNGGSNPQSYALNGIHDGTCGPRHKRKMKRLVFEHPLSGLKIVFGSL